QMVQGLCVRVVEELLGVVWSSGKWQEMLKNEVAGLVGKKGIGPCSVTLAEWHIQPLSLILIKYNFGAWREKMYSSYSDSNPGDEGKPFLVLAKLVPKAGMAPGLGLLGNYKFSPCDFL
nr:hypothetical protein [Tanacetum cinerariifolium]